MRIEQFDRARHGAGRAAFDCGQEVFNEFFRRYAAQQQKDLIIALFVGIDEQSRLIAGYYTLSTATIEFAPGTAKALGPAAKAYNTIPAILLGRMARDVRFRGQGVGEALIKDAMHRALAVAKRQVGAHAFVADPYEPWLVDKIYRPLGFVPLREEEPSGRQVILLATVAAAMR